MEDLHSKEWGIKKIKTEEGAEPQKAFSAAG